MHNSLVQVANAALGSGTISSQRAISMLSEKKPLLVF